MFHGALPHGPRRQAERGVTTQQILNRDGVKCMPGAGYVGCHGGVPSEGKGRHEDESQVGHEQGEAKNEFGAVIVQLAVINVVFSLDSVITAVGMTDILAVMILAVILSTLVMAVAAKPLADYIERQPTMKMLALAFILLVGVALVADGLGFHIPRGYLYFAIAFSLGVEILNIRARRRADAAVAKGAGPHRAA